MAKRRQRRRILPEEDYQRQLSDVIGRDYFPDVQRLETQVALQNRRAAGDFAGAVAVRRAARFIQEHDDVVVQEEAQYDACPVRPVARPLGRESLSNFHARVTSEDNADFEMQQTKDLAERRSARQQQYELPMLTNFASKRTTPSPFRLASDLFDASPLRIANNQAATSINTVFFVPDTRIISETTDSSATLLTNQSDADLMPPPQNLPKRQLVEYQPRPVVKSIEPAATRFPSSTELALRSTHARHFEEQSRAGDDSTSHYSSSDAVTTDLDDESPPHRSLSAERRQARKRKVREQNTLVDMTPLIVPGLDASPLTTWGTVSSTPLRISGTDTPNKAASSTQFSLPAQSAREQAARIALKTLEQRRHGQASVVRSKHRATPRHATLSARSRSAFGTALRTCYKAPSSSSSSRQGSISSAATLASKRRHASVSTPRIQSGPSSSVPSTKVASLKGLLHLPTDTLSLEP